MTKSFAVAMLVLLGAIGAKAQTLVTETDISMSGLSYTPSDAIAKFEDGTFVRIEVGSTGQIKAFVQAAGEPTLTITTVATPWTVTASNISGVLIYHYTVEPFSVTTTYGNTVNVTLAAWTERLIQRSGRGGGNSWQFYGGTEDITIGYVN